MKPVIATGEPVRPRPNGHRLIGPHDRHALCAEVAAPAVSMMTTSRRTSRFRWLLRTPFPKWSARSKSGSSRPNGRRRRHSKIIKRERSSRAGTGKAGQNPVHQCPESKGAGRCGTGPGIMTSLNCWTPRLQLDAGVLGHSATTRMKARIASVRNLTRSVDPLPHREWYRRPGGPGCRFPGWCQ